MKRFPVRYDIGIFENGMQQCPDGGWVSIDHYTEGERRAFIAGFRISRDNPSGIQIEGNDIRMFTPERAYEEWIKIGQENK